MLKLETRRADALDNAKTGMAARIFRKDMGVSMRRVASLMCVSATYVMYLETGKRRWTKKTMARYQRALERGQRKQR
jgi:transcriptional regulator with XRE-family HTH domain